MLSVCCKVMTMSAASSIENEKDDNEFWFSHIERSGQMYANNSLWWGWPSGNTFLVGLCKFVS